MNIGFTGTRQGMSSFQKEALETFTSRVSIEKAYHGGCIGADEEFHKICLRLKDYSQFPMIVVFPSNLKAQQGDWSRADYVDKERDPISRNHIIVEKADLLIATPKSNDEELRSGTWATIRYAKKIRVPVLILPRE